jgi:hypothetical protein
MRWAGGLAAAVALTFVSVQLLPSAVTLPQAASPPDPQSVSFTVGANDPLVAQGVLPADILSAGGNAVILCDDLGLLCVDPITSDYDVIGGLSYGQDFVSTESMPIQFSVAQSSLGLPGTAVRAEAACSPGEPQADVFATAGNGSNVQVLDGDGVACGANSSAGLYLGEGASSSDLSALDGEACALADPNCDGVPENPVFLTLAPGSPMLTDLGASSADILMAGVDYVPLEWADGAADLGLNANDAIDALCVLDNGDGVYGSGDRVLFSLAPGSPTLAAQSFSPADILAPGSPPSRRYTAASLGLQAGDNVDAMMCASVPFTVYLPVILKSR